MIHDTLFEIWFYVIMHPKFELDDSSLVVFSASLVLFLPVHGISVYGCDIALSFSCTVEDWIFLCVN